MDLDDLLASSAPPIAVRTPGLGRELDDLVARSEASRSRRWPIRSALVGASLAGVLGIGAVASAAGVLPGWPAFLTSSGQTCDVALSVSALQPGEGEQPIASTFSPAEKRESLAAARAFLADYDYSSVNRAEAISWWKAEETRVNAAQPDPLERQPLLTGDDLEVTAVSRWVLKDLEADLSAQGLDIRAVMVGTSYRCTP